MTIQGKINEIFDTKQVNPTFSKREFILEYAPNPLYPQFLKLELAQEKCSILNFYKVGDEVEVHFELRGKPYTNKSGEKFYNNTLLAWRIDRIKKDTDTYADNARLELDPGAEEGNEG